MKGPALGDVPMAGAPWIVSDAFWTRIERVLPKKERRFRYPGRKRLEYRAALQGILFGLHTGMTYARVCLSTSERVLVDPAVALPTTHAEAQAACSATNMRLYISSPVLVCPSALRARS